MKRFWPLLLIGLAIAGAVYLLRLPAPAPTTVRVNRENPALQAAIDRARRDLPAFRARLRLGGEARFAIRARFTSPAGPEYLWVKDPKPKGTGFEGILDQNPISARNLTKGDLVKITEADVVDWLVREKDRTVGAFTESALQAK